MTVQNAATASQRSQRLRSTNRVQTAIVKVNETRVPANMRWLHS